MATHATRVAALDEEHLEASPSGSGQRLGESPFALALEPLGRLARAAKRTLGGSTVEALISEYVARWLVGVATSRQSKR